MWCTAGGTHTLQPAARRQEQLPPSKYERRRRKVGQDRVGGEQRRLLGRRQPMHRRGCRALSVVWAETDMRRQSCYDRAVMCYDGGDTPV